MPVPDAPLHEYGADYFDSYNYENRRLGRFSMYGIARRYYAGLIRRFAPARAGPARLLEMGSGMGHLLGLLEDEFDTFGFDVARWAAHETARNAPATRVLVASADRLEVFAPSSFDVVVALHLVEHLEDPARALAHVSRMLRPGGLLLFATPNPVYALRPLKRPDVVPDAISLDPTHINVHPPETWLRTCEGRGLRVLHAFGDGLWDVPYLPLLPKAIQFALFGMPSLVQVLSRRPLLPPALGVNLVVIARKGGDE